MSGIYVELRAAPIVGPAAVVAMAVIVILLARRDLMSFRRLLTATASVVYVAAVITLTFFPLQIATGDHGNRASLLEKAQLIPVATIDVRTFVLNMALFVPFGALLRLWKTGRVTWAVAARYGLVASAAIEICQFVTNVAFSSGRAADVNDLIANTAGAVLGFFASVLFVRQRRDAVLDVWKLKSRRSVPELEQDPA